MVTANRWYESIQEIHFQPDPNIRCNEFPCAIRFSGYGSRFYYRGGLRAHFQDFQPDIVHLEEEPWSVNALQVTRLKRKYCPDSRFIFRTSLSIPAKQKFGFLPVWIERQVFRETDVAFPLSENAGRILKQRGYSGDAIPFPNGVDLRLFHKMDVSDLRTSLGLDSYFVIGYLGRIIESKGLDTLIASAARLDIDYRLLIIGDGEHKPSLVKIAEELGVTDRIVWVDGMLPEKVAEFVNCMNTIVLPSRTTPDWVEFFGRVIIEGMACEVPVIGSDSGEIPRVIGDAGLVFPEGDAEALADQINRIALDPTFARQLIERGLKRVHEFTWETIAERTYQVYRSMLES
ncbi:MAG: glycosyltransferase family 4 protein [Candidatus Poribacteria bacterium]|nr:glycosyltransferase family 4 protein [Candidatus Poribacteria bacterium]